MFDRIAPRYDLVNTVLSAGGDGYWRWRAARATGLGAGGRALDVACGSGRLTALLQGRAGPGGQVVGLDFSREMLGVAGHDLRGLPLVQGDDLKLPFPAQSFDSVTIAFGLRNLADPSEGMREMARVLRPGGRAVVLEFVRPPRGPVGAGYRFYLRHLLPALGGWLSGAPDAYRYLSDTVDSYRTPAELAGLAAAAQWRAVRLRTLALGTVGLLSGSPSSHPRGEGN